MSPQNDVLIHTTTGLRVLISADSLCAGLKVAVFIRVGVSAAARCITDVAVATKKSSSSISSRARLSPSTPMAQIFFRVLIAVTENLTRYGCKLKATMTRRTKNHFTIDCCTVECPKHCVQSGFFFKLISFLEDSEKMENRSQVDSNGQWLKW